MQVLDYLRPVQDTETVSPFQMEDGDDRSKDFMDELNLQVLYVF